MTKIFIYKTSFNGQELSVDLSGVTEANGDVTVSALNVARAAFNIPQVTIPKDVLTPDGSAFKKDGGVPFDYQREITLAAGVSSFLDLIEATAGFKATLRIHVPAIGPQDSPFFDLEVCGGLAINVGPFSELDKTLCYRLTLQELPLDLSLKLPELSLRFPRFKLPKLTLPDWHFPELPKSFKLPALHLEPISNPLPIEIGWDKFQATFDNVTKKTTLEFTYLRVSSSLVPKIALKGDLTLVFDQSLKLVAGESKFKRYEPDIDNFKQLNLKELHVDAKCFAVKLTEPHLNFWLRSLAPNLFDENDAAALDLSLIVIFGQTKPVEQIRLDWDVSVDKKTLTLPGLQVTPPNQSRFTLLLGADNDLAHIALNLTLPKDATLQLNSNFAWERGDDREIHGNEGDAAVKHLFELKATAKADISLDLLDFNLDAVDLPRFLQQLNKTIAKPDFPNPATLRQPVDFAHTRLGKNSWELQFKINPETLANKYTLPLLNIPKEVGQKLEQFISLLQEAKKKVEEALTFVDFEHHTIGFPIQIEIHIGDLKLDTKAILVLDWEKFALSVDHEKGLEFYSTKPELPDPQGGEHLGLSWSFKGRDTGEMVKEEENGVLVDRKKFHYFTLLTDKHNYQIKQAPGAVFRVMYTKLSKDPIGFAVEDFALTPKGIDLTALVIDQPVRLNGLDTKFCFQGSRLEIKENHIRHLTLMGSGPLPPALVGDAMADVALEFDQSEEGNLILSSGNAKLRGQKLLKCEETRFRFSIDAIELDFVFDGRFHLFFRLTGSAEFVLASGDDGDWALAWLPKIKINLVKCPLTGDARVIAKHIDFLVELPTPKTFHFLGCFEMELRGIGFVPQAEEFDGDAAMQLTGQVKFAQGAGDTPDPRVNYHRMLIGLPERGKLIPRIHFTGIPVNLNFGAAFRLNGVVEYSDKALEQGFSGEGTLQIQGLPTFAAAFAFLRIRRSESSPWLRAWFIYLEVRQVSFLVPLLEIYMREVGLGFGYRFTLASIKAADEVNDVRQLLKELTVLSRTQGDLSRRDRWAVDLEELGHDPRWTIVFRALFSQTSAAPSPLQYNAEKEKDLACVFLFDAVVAFRSDLTFFMSARAWINTNYHDYFINNEGIREKPLLSGFVLLSPRQKRFLAHVASNPNGRLGPHPPLPDFIQTAISGAQFSATLLIEPGLLHYELGWPNMLRWSGDLGPLKAEFRGGFIFRISRQELVTGTSFTAHGNLSIKAELNLGFFGVRVVASADVAFGARYIGVLDFHNPSGQSAIYGAVGLEIRIEIAIEAWIHIELFLTSIDITFHLSVSIGFTAGLEVGLAGLTPDKWGLRGDGTLALSVMGHDLHIHVHLGFGEDNVQTAFNRTSRFLSIGLEATDVEKVPGVDAAPQTLNANGNQPSLLALPAPAPSLEPTAPDGAAMAETTLASVSVPTAKPDMTTTLAAEAVVKEFHLPDYSIFVVRQPDADGFSYFVLLPQGKKINTDGVLKPEQGFLPAPPKNKGILDQITSDFDLQFPASSDSFELQQFMSDKGEWVPSAKTDGKFHANWRVNWDATYAPVKEAIRRDDGKPDPNAPKKISLADYLSTAFYKLDEELGKKDFILAGDPDEMPAAEDVDDERVNNPTDDAYEAAVRGAVEQFRGSPYFKKDRTNPYEALLDDAFNNATTIYDKSGVVPNQPPEQQTKDEQDKLANILRNQQAWQTRGMIIQEIVGQVSDYASGACKVTAENLEALKRAGLPKDVTDKLEGLLNQQFQSLAAFREVLQTLTGAQPKIIDTIVINCRLSSGTLDSSIPFQMGLVFRYKEHTETSGTGPEDWLDKALADKEKLPKIKQRKGPEAIEPDAEQKIVRVFNLTQTDFSRNPPRFQRMQQYTDAHTIAFAWDLTWDAQALEQGTPQLIETQKDPHHHLMHYLVRRRALDTNEREAVYTVKPSNALHLDTKDGVMKRLKPRFQLVDHFTGGDLPASGQSYLYSITPKDCAGNSGRVLAIVATRFPNEPPAVPADAKLVVEYLEGRETFLPERATPPGDLRVVVPGHLQVEWTNASIADEKSSTAVAEHWLIFRREETVPVGSYGLDSTTQRPRSKSLPTSNARPLPTDIKVKLSERDIQDHFSDGDAAQSISVVALSIKDLQAKGVFPPDAQLQWRPEAWRCFMQTVSTAGVPSALAPVQIEIRMQAGADPAKQEQRQPAELEWIPFPVRLPMLPPEDERAIPGTAHFPMPLNLPHPPDDSPFIFKNGEVEKRISYRKHPSGIRCIRFRWNQGPSGANGYPLELNAGYHLFELDADAHTTETFADSVKLNNALRKLQEVQMLPAEDLLLHPSDTLNTSQWEAWYPSTILRERTKEKKQEQNSETPHGPWYSWRESMLEWPEWPGLTDAETGQGGTRADALHFFLQDLIYTLTDDDRVRYQTKDNNGTPQELPLTFNADLQTSPPMQPVNFNGFLNSTARAADPYGWGILQRFGLSVTLALRYAQSLHVTGEAEHREGELVGGQKLLEKLGFSLEKYKGESLFFKITDDTNLPPDIGQKLSALKNQIFFGRAKFIPALKNALGEGLTDILLTDILSKAQVKDGPKFVDFYKYLHVELLVQPDRRVELDEAQFSADALLAIVQLSLRPAIRQRLKYGSVTITGTGGAIVDVLVTPTTAVSVIKQTETNLGQKQPDQDDEKKPSTAENEQLELEPVIKRKISLKLPPNGMASLLFRGAEMPQVEVSAEGNAITELDPAPQLFSPRDERSTYFSIDTAALAQRFVADNALSKQWMNFKRYAEALTSTPQPESEGNPKIVVPIEPDKLKDALPDYLAWTQRFFDASGDVFEANGLGEIKLGAWVATAYPRASAPVAISPDKGGRLTYDHLLEDKWAHNYRYYIKPYGRYDLLWQSFSQSVKFFSAPNDELPEAQTYKLTVKSLEAIKLQLTNLLPELQRSLPDERKAELAELFKNAPARLDVPAFRGREFFSQAEFSKAMSAQLGEPILKAFRQLEEAGKFVENGLLDIFGRTVLAHLVKFIEATAREFLLYRISDNALNRLDQQFPGDSDKQKVRQKLQQLLAPDFVDFEKFVGVLRQKLVAENVISEETFRTKFLQPILNFSEKNFATGAASAASFIITERAVANLRLEGVTGVALNTAQHLEGQTILGQQNFFGHFAGVSAADLFHLFRYAQKRFEALPETEGGLDVVLDRIYPVARPLVLSSRRLDEIPERVKVVSPGRIWEVIIARHPEQALIERNQTLARQLSFRQIAFTMTRRFAFPEWGAQLGKTITPEHSTIKIIPVKDNRDEVAPPSDYPKQPDHIDVEGWNANDETVRSIALPERLDTFQQGALALQWEALPFYYHHRLMMVAQTTSVVSPVNQLIQRDFEYRTPALQEKSVEVEGGQLKESTNPLATRVLHLPLKRFWDSLTDEVQQRWGVEKPGPYKVKDGIVNANFASLPDREVVYQIVEVFNGNVEVQAEIFFDENITKYSSRQLGKRFVVKQIKLPLPADQAEHFLLNVTMQQDSANGAAQPPLEPFAELPLSRRVTVPAEMSKFAKFVDPKDCRLSWTGQMTGDEANIVRSLGGDEPFKAALSRLITSASAASVTPKDVFTEIAPLGVEQIPSEFKDKLSLSAEADNLHYKEMQWTGLMTEEQEQRLKDWSQQAAFPPEVNVAVLALIKALNTREFKKPLPGTALDIKIPDALKEKLSIDPVVNPTSVTWKEKVNAMGKGRLDEKQLAALNAIDAPNEFKLAVQKIVADLKSPVSAAFKLARRPQPEQPPQPGQPPEQLPEAIKGKLLLGKQLLHLTELLSARQAAALQQQFMDSPVDREAIVRLYEDSLLNALKQKFGSVLKLRARRGSAAPSNLIELIVKPIPQP
jgi:hypothetical protein